MQENTRQSAYRNIIRSALYSDADNDESMSSTAATLVAIATDNVNKDVRKVRLVSCVLFLLVRYHDAVRLTKASID